MTHCSRQGFQLIEGSLHISTTNLQVQEARHVGEPKRLLQLANQEPQASGTGSLASAPDRTQTGTYLQLDK